MSGIKGRILLVISCVIAVLSIAACAVGGYMVGDMAKQNLEATFVTYNWGLIRIACTAALGVLAALLAVPNIVLARQVSRMYDVSRKYAHWSAVSAIVGVVMLLATAAAVAGTVYEIGQMGALLMMLVDGLDSILPLQIGAGIGVLFMCVSLLLPLLLSLRVRDSVSAMVRKKRARSGEDE